ncbi:MAG: glutamate synthase (NADPH/NADH) large chain, partial [Myxococcota bacterium]
MQVLNNLRHRGASGAEANVGDGAGILLQVPHEFMVKACHAVGIRLPGRGQYGVGMLFLPRRRPDRWRVQHAFERIIGEEGLSFLGWRPVPTINASLGAAATDSEPVISQVLVGRPDDIDDAEFERRLYVLRRRCETTIVIKGFYICSLSHRTVVYKGMLTAEQLEAYFPDLMHPATVSALAVVHSRFSTNTFPSWDRAHPYRFAAHNGEINTLRGNVNWMHTRQSLLESELLGDSLRRVLPVIDETGSDSSMLDNTLEFLVQTGRSLPHAMMMMVPEPWERHETMSEKRRAFYRYHSCFMEPWDGPAAIVATDGVTLCAMLDRNGLRPARYYLTDDDRLILSSEVGVVDVPPERIVRKGRLRPGHMLLVDTREGRIVSDDDVKERIAGEHPYAEWSATNTRTLDDLPPAPEPADEPTPMLQLQQTFGYTSEEVSMLLEPMAEQGKEAIGSMGTDTPLAVLSNRPRLLYEYFKQLFAQVTNPPIDASREKLVTATGIVLGPTRNMLAPVPEAARVFELPHPLLTNEALARVRAMDQPGLRATTLALSWDPTTGGDGLEMALEDLFAAADAAIEQGFAVLVLSDRGITEERAPIPALLATAGLHHHLIRNQRRTRVGLVVETGEAREVHHFALLLGYGAGAVNPWLALDTVRHIGPDSADNYIKAAVTGVIKVISKMGISTFSSYCGAAIFEAIGLSTELVERYFDDTPTRIEGAGMDILAEEVRRRHAEAFRSRGGAPAILPSGGEYKWRPDGEAHLFGPRAVHLLQNACRTNNYEKFREYSDVVDRQQSARCTLRSMFKMDKSRPSVPQEEVENISAIVSRFETGAMSYGSISGEAHEALAIAMNRLGARSNTGEGGEDPRRFTPDPNGDSRKSYIKQVASGRFGVTSEYLVSAQEIQIKMAQGAKPGEGGQLPGHKVWPWIAKVRFSTPGVGLISPPPHHDIYSIEDLAQLIFDLKNANPRAKINVKLVSTVGVGTIAAGVAKARADAILISGYDGGTGASPLTSIKHTGVPWELGLAETHQTLLLNGLRSRVQLGTDGGLKTGRDVVMAALLGAERFGFSTAPLVVLGCVYMRVCHLDTCPVGIATQNPELRKRYTGDPGHVVNYMRFVAQQVRELLAELGFRTMDELIGRSEILKAPESIDHWKASGLKLDNILHRPKNVPAHVGGATASQDHH